jgi:hypothetical protein
VYNFRILWLLIILLRYLRRIPSEREKFRRAATLAVSKDGNLLDPKKSFAQRIADGEQVDSMVNQGEEGEVDDMGPSSPKKVRSSDSLADSMSIAQHIHSLVGNWKKEVRGNLDALNQISIGSGVGSGGSVQQDNVVSEGIKRYLFFTEMDGWSKELGFDGKEYRILVKCFVYKVIYKRNDKIESENVTDQLEIISH